MAQYLGTVKLGGFYNNGAILKRPTRPWRNAPKGEQLSASITSEKLYALGLNTVNNLVISASDGQGGTTYRRLTFKRTNSAPAISGQDEDLGQQTGSFAEKYTVCPNLPKRYPR